MKLKPIVWVIATLLTQNAHAQDNAKEDNVELNLQNISVTGNPLGNSADELVVPVTVLNGRELSLRRQSTLGETLNGTPGVSATQFGPNASRPVIRGLDGDRVKVMQNGVGVLDASALSFDHAVAVDPLIVEQIDVVRGPAALLYGGNATGGVVNASDNRIPKDQINGITGRAEARFGGAEMTRNGAAVVDAGNERFAIHADVYGRQTNDMDIPGFAVSQRKFDTDGTARANSGKLINSAADNKGGALGASLTFDNGYLGFSYGHDSNLYGTVAEEAVKIDMRNDRFDVASEFRELGSFINRVKFRMAYTDYEHKEIDTGVVGTTFKNRGFEGTMEAGHDKILGLDGVIGFQFKNTDFSALGDEAFLPQVNSQSQALYVYEELPLSDSEKAKHKVTFGARVGHNSEDSSDNPNFGAGQRISFTPSSFALGGLYSLNENWALTSNLSHNERAPSYFELYANGPHVATNQFEVGDTNLKIERSNGLDAQLRWRQGRDSMNFGAYYTRFSNFIALLNTGNFDPVNNLAIAQYTPVRAVFKGVEFDGKFGISEHTDFTLRGDYVNARDETSNAYLPRIAPLRLGAGLQYALGNFSARLDALHAFAQNKIAPLELATNDYTDVSALVAYKLPVQHYNMEVFAKANNLLNEEIRDHASFLKDVSPAGARALLVGVRADF